MSGNAVNDGRAALSKVGPDDAAVLMVERAGKKTYAILKR